MKYINLHINLQFRLHDKNCKGNKKCVLSCYESSISVTSMEKSYINGKSNDLYEEIYKKPEVQPRNWEIRSTIYSLLPLCIWKKLCNHDLIIEFKFNIQKIAKLIKFCNKKLINKKLWKFGWRWNWKNNSVIIIIPLRYIYNIKFQEKDGKNMYEIYIERSNGRWIHWNRGNGNRLKNEETISKDDNTSFLPNLLEWWCTII